MNRYSISEEQYNELKPVSSFSKNRNINAFAKVENGKCYILTEDIEDVIDLISDYIYFRCMDEEQEKCNEEGKRLYSLIDELAFRDPDDENQAS